MTPSTMSSPASAEVLATDRTAGDQPPDGGATGLGLLQERLGHAFADPRVLTVALTHRSWCAEHDGESNERLEFLGDAVLGLAVTERVFRTRPDRAEGDLAKIRAAVVSEGTLAAVARSIRLGDHLRLGRGEATSGGRDKPSILADAMEAVIGAVFIDGGPDRATGLVHRLLSGPIEAASLDPGTHDYKTRLQEMVAGMGEPAPAYTLTEEGPDHDRVYTAHVRVAGSSHGPGTGTSKKRAEQAAARIAWEGLAGGDRAQAEEGGDPQ